MARVEIFWRAGCNFCVRVQDLFEQKGIDYISYNIWEDDDASLEVKKRVPNSRTVPQVFINGNHIGGCDDTVALDASGELDKLLIK